jgi:uncharacterized protein (TIGR01777 family)
MRVAITGASGFIGASLARNLAADGHSVAAIGRDPGALAAIDGADAVVHLAGEPLAQRWTAVAKKRIRSSRIEGTRRLIDALRGLAKPPATLVSASAIGIYGSRGDEILTEQSFPGNDFLASLCVEWEHEAQAAANLGVRVVRLRTGMVLGRGGGALAKMLPVFRTGLGGRLGGGGQWMSWIHIDDLVALIRHAIDLPALGGPVNATAPNPVTNAVFTEELAAALHRSTFLPVPEFALKLLYGEMSEVLLASQRVVPVAAEAAGFRFRYPQLPPALRNLFD